MIKLAITGSIGMGKTTTAKLFEKQGIPMFDADQAVHDLYTKNQAAIAAIAAKFPKAIQNNVVNRDALSAHLAKHPDDFPKLEEIIHPLILAQREIWTQQQDKNGELIILFDIPLLFETGGAAFVDYCIVVSAPSSVQKKRVLARAGMHEQKFEQIVSRQMPDAQKRENADYIIHTDTGFTDASLQVKAVLRHIRTRVIRPKRT